MGIRKKKRGTTWRRDRGYRYGKHMRTEMGEGRNKEDTGKEEMEGVGRKEEKEIVMVLDKDFEVAKEVTIQQEGSKRKGDRGEPEEDGIRNKGVGKNKGSTRGKKKDQPTKVKGTKDDWWAKREMIQGNKDNEDDKSLNSSRDEERVDEAAVVERNRVRRKTTKAANQDQGMETEDEENVENKDEGGCAKCGTIDDARMIECDWCSAWMCIECSGLGDEG